jgi:hypothetical protein
MSNGQFDHPRGMTMDASGNLYVLDHNLNNVQKLNAS